MTGRPVAHWTYAPVTIEKGYWYQERNRDRRNGLTLTEDWNAIRGGTFRMIMAWYDYDEDSNTSRDTTTGASPGTYYVRVKNSDGTLSQPIVVTVYP